MAKTLIEIVQPSPTAVIDVRVVVRTSDGQKGVRNYAFEHDVSFAEILVRIGQTAGDTIDVRLRAAPGSAIRREALRSAEIGYVDIGGDMLQTQRDRALLERCFGKDVLGS